MQYVACLRVGQNDIKALINLEPERRDVFTPLLDMRGDDDRHLQTFLATWTDHPFFLDVSRVRKDVGEDFIGGNDLHNASDAFENKQQFFLNTQQSNNKAVAEAECNTVIDLKLEHDAA